MEYRFFNILCPNGYVVKLLFKQYEHNGDWICAMTQEFMQDFQTLLPENYQENLLQ